MSFWYPSYFSQKTGPDISSKLPHYIGDNMHELLKSGFWGKIRHYFKISSAETYSQHAQRYMNKSAGFLSTAVTWLRTTFKILRRCILLIVFLLLCSVCRHSLISDVQYRILSNIRGMFEMNCLFLSGDFKFQVSPKVIISCPRSTSRG